MNQQLSFPLVPAQPLHPKFTCPQHPTAKKIVSPGTPPHVARLECECGRFLKWIGKSDLIENEIDSDLAGGEE